jgi:hypothetical protein
VSEVGREGFGRLYESRRVTTGRGRGQGTDGWIETAVEVPREGRRSTRVETEWEVEGREEERAHGKGKSQFEFDYESIESLYEW